MAGFAAAVRAGREAGAVFDGLARNLQVNRQLADSEARTAILNRGQRSRDRARQVAARQGAEQLGLSRQRLAQGNETVELERQRLAQQAEQFGVTSGLQRDQLAQTAQLAKLMEEGRNQRFGQEFGLRAELGRAAQALQEGVFQNDKMLDWAKMGMQTVLGLGGLANDTARTNIAGQEARTSAQVAKSAIKQNEARAALIDEETKKLGFLNSLFSGYQERRDANAYRQLQGLQQLQAGADLAAQMGLPDTVDGAFMALQSAPTSGPWQSQLQLLAQSAGLPAQEAPGGQATQGAGLLARDFVGPPVPVAQEAGEGAPPAQRRVADPRPSFATSRLLGASPGPLAQLLDSPETIMDAMLTQLPRQLGLVTDPVAARRARLAQGYVPDGNGGLVAPRRRPTIIQTAPGQAGGLLGYGP